MSMPSEMAFHTEPPVSPLMTKLIFLTFFTMLKCQESLLTIITKFRYVSDPSHTSDTIGPHVFYSYLKQITEQLMA